MLDAALAPGAERLVLIPYDFAPACEPAIARGSGGSPGARPLPVVVQDLGGPGPAAGPAAGPVAVGPRPPAGPPGPGPAPRAACRRRLRARAPPRRGRLAGGPTPAGRGPGPRRARARRGPCR
ncbi:MAG: hypothetical protein LAT64_14250, partial [Phycisphaerales bacterium]|nr:hypothetical protein [Phycisphaerales bacterium]